MAVSLCVRAHRLHSGRTHKFWVEVPKRAGQSCCCLPHHWQTTAVCCPTWIINKRAQKQRAWLHVHSEGRFLPLPLQDAAPNVLFSPLVEGKLIYTIRLDSFNTYRKFILRRDLSTSHSSVGNISPCFSWMTVTETPTVNHPRR